MEPSASPTPAFVPGPVSCDDCPNGYEKFGNMCLRGYTTKMNMTSAEAECEAFGAHLVSIHDPEEEDYLEEFLSEYIETQSELIDNHDKNFWIGLGLDTETMDRFWTDGSTFLYDNWLEGHENDVSQQCAVVAGATKRLGKWNDKGCSSLYYPICMYPYVSCESSHSPHYSIEYSYFSIEYSYSWEHSYHMGEYSYYEEEYSYSYLWEYSYFMEEYSYSFDVGCGSCPKGFSKYGDGCFTTFAESVDRDTAQSLCEEVGSKLATIDTQRTQDEVEDFLFELVEETQDWTRKTQLNFWIGLKHEPAGSEQYKWADGASHTSNFYNWYSNNADKQDCTTISTVSKKFGMWNDKGCQTLARPLCASEMTKASCPTKAATSAPGTTVPTASPTAAPTAAPAASPTLALTSAPTASPSGSPSLSPTAQPTASPSGSPSISPTAQPTAAPSGSPSLSPTAQPTAAPSGSPSLSPTAQPTGVPCGRCPADFSKFGGSCLKAFTDLKNKKSAERQCRSLGARLVSVRDCDQEAYLMEYLHYHLSTHSHLNSNEKKFWMDLELLENGSDFGWGDGTPFEYSHWPVTFAGPDSSQPCATMSGQIQSLGEWGTASCLELFAPFCEYEFESCEPGQQTDQPQFVPEVPTPLPTTSSGTPVEDFWSFSFSYSFEFLMPGMDPSTLDDELDDEDDQEECPPGFALYGELCLKGFVAPKNFLDAESSCRMLGATLVGIHSEAEDALVDLYLREFLNMNPNLPEESHVWIGLFKEENGKYGWTDGTPLGYDRWDSGRNQDDIAKSCTAVTKDEQGRSSWNSKHCHAENTYICSVYSEKSQPRHASKPVDLPLHFPMGSGDEQKEKPTPGIPCTGCPKGYQQSGDHCLKFYADSATMDEAESVCGADKAHLASIHSAEEQEGIYEFVDSFLTSNFVPDFQRGFWLGSTLNEDGILGWTDGTELNYFFARAPGTEDFGCTVVSGFMEGRRWQGKDCNSHASALCMRPPVCDIHGGNTQTDMAAAKTGDAHPVSAEMIIPARHLFLDGSASKHGQSIRLVDTSGTYGSASIPMALSRSLGFLSNTFILDFDLTISSPEERSECGDTFVLNLGNNKESSCADPEKNLHDASCNAIGLALVSNSDVTFPGVKSYVNGVVESVFPYTALFENKKTHIRVEFRPEGAMCNIQYFFDEKNIFGQSFEHFDEAAFENTHAEIQFSARSREECSALYEISDVVITTEKEFSTFEKQMFLMYMELENPALLWEFAEYDLMQRGVMSSLVEIYPNEKVHDAEGWQNTSALRARLVGVGSATLFIGAILYLKRMRNNRYGSYSPL